MSDYTPSKYDHLFEGEPWTEIAKSAGIAPGHTEAQARRVASVAADEIARLRSLNAELVGALRKAPNAVTAAYQQAHAEWQMHDRVEARHEKVVSDFLNEARAALSRARAKEDT